MSVMGKKVGQPPVEPGSSTAGSPSVHKIQGSVGIIFTGQGTVHAFNGFRCDLYRVDGAVGYRLKLGWLVYNCLYAVREFSRQDTVNDHIRNQYLSLGVADSRLRLDNAQEYLVIFIRIFNPSGCPALFLRLFPGLLFLSLL